MKSTTLHTSRGIRGLRLLAAAGTAAAVARTAAAVALGTVLIPVLPAAAHHGWPGFETDHLVYIAGMVSSDGVWGNPHSQFDVTLDSSLPADTPELAIPEQLQDPEDSVRVNAALSYKGPTRNWR